MTLFQGKTAFISGSSRGIGKAIALMLARNGACVILNATHRSPQAKAALKLVRSYSPKSYLIIGNVGNYRTVNRIKNLIISHNHQIDYLICNAGITRDTTIKKMTFSQWDEVLKVNLYGYFNCLTHFLPLINTGGRIIAISSVIAQTGGFGQANYAAAKAGMLGLTKSVALELATTGITVNAICPGFIETDMTNAVPKNIIDTRIMPKIPIKRFGSPEEVAELVKYLCLPEASYITGQSLNINGGLF